nr:unnamed protein product [Digitaria exilis]
MEQTETARPAAATRGARTHGEIRRPGEGFPQELRHSSLSLCNHSPMNKARIEQSTIHGEVLLSHTDLSRELDMRDGERMMEHTLALMVASSRALLGASPPAASAAAAGLRWGERNGRKAAAEGGEGSGTLE